MAYTESQLAKVEAALIALASGERIVRVTIEGKNIEYGQADIDKLRAFRDTVKNEIQAVAGRPQFFRTSTSKGL